jgi:prepilin-type N-terminal cleavage/methylation domain-containing protein
MNHTPHPTTAPPSPPKPNQHPSAAFTLTEILVSVAILSILTLAMIQILNQASKMWTRAQDKSDAYREARAALHRIATDLRRAHITSYSPIIINPSPDLLPATADPTSSLFFIAKQPTIVTDAASPIAINDIADLCSIGYYAAYAPDSYDQPSGPTNPSRFNLYRYYRGSEITTNYILANRFPPQSFWNLANLATPATSITPPAGLGRPALINAANAPFLNPTNATQALSRPDDLLARNITGLKIILESNSNNIPNSIDPLEATYQDPPTPTTILPPPNFPTLPAPATLYIGLTAYSDQNLAKLRTQSDWTDDVAKTDPAKKIGRSFSIRVPIFPAQ